MADGQKQIFDRKEVYVGRDFGGITTTLRPTFVATTSREPATTIRGTEARRRSEGRSLPR